VPPATTHDREERRTPSGVRLRAHGRREGDLNWLFLPGGPGIGSESLLELVDVIEVPGTSWLVDLPGDGSNRAAPGAPEDPYSLWPQVLLEAAEAVDRPVFVGHSTGGMYLLSTPALEQVLVGMALVSTAPDASWLPAFVEMTRHHPLPAVEHASAVYESEPTDGNLREIAVSSAPWNFTPGGLARGAELLRRMPYNGAAVAWSDAHFDHDYTANWWPRDLPTLIVSGGDDRIVTQTLWDDPRFTAANVIRRIIDGGAHFPWIDEPLAVRAAFADLAEAIAAGDADPVQSQNDLPRRHIALPDPAPDGPPGAGQR
jgi:pimeloyl-ACP methyl ester carboxylesterase